MIESFSMPLENVIEVMVLSLSEKCMCVHNLCSQFSLCVVIMCHKVPRSAEFSNTGPWSPGKTQSQAPVSPWSQCFHQHITWCYVCFCFETFHLSRIVGSLTLNAQPTALSFMPKQILPNACMFYMTVTVLLHLGAPDSTSTVCWGPCETVESPTSSTKKRIAWN